MKIETERLIIRNFINEDIIDVFEYLSDPLLMEYIEPIFTFQQTKAFIEKYGIDEKFIFAIEEKSLGKVIGHVIFHEFNKPLEYELGWIINKKFQGYGYARETSLALFEYGFNILHLESILAETVLDNKKSIATIESVGMKISETHQEDLPVWIITKNDYENKFLYSLEKIKDIKMCLNNKNTLFILGQSMYKPNEEKLNALVKKYLKDKNIIVYGYLEDNVVEGIIVLDTTDTDNIIILNIAVSKHMQTKGIGSKLIDYSIKKLNAKALIAETDDDAIGFYRKYGFEIIKLDNKYVNNNRYECKYTC